MEITGQSNPFASTRVESNTGTKRRKLPGWLLFFFLLIIFIVLLGITSGPELVVRIDNTAGQTLDLYLGPQTSAQLIEYALLAWPDSADLRNTLGQKYYDGGDSALAVRQFELALASDPDRSIVRNNLGVVLISIDQAGEAIEHLLVASELDPGSEVVLLNLARAYIAEQQWDLSAEALYQAVSLDPENSDTWMLIGFNEINRGNFDQAYQSFFKALEMNDAAGQVMQGLGVAAMKMGNIQDARLFLDASRLIEPENVKTHLYFGQVVESLGQTEQAVEAFEKVIDLSNDTSLIEIAKAQLSALSTVDSTEPAK